MGALQDDDDGLAKRSDNDLRSFRDEIDVLEILEHDERPIIIVTENSPQIENQPTKNIIFSNSAFQRIQTQIKHSERPNGDVHDELSLDRWIEAITGYEAQQLSWRNHVWKASTTGRWQIIRGSSQTIAQDVTPDIMPKDQVNGTSLMDNNEGSEQYLLVRFG